MYIIKTGQESLQRDGQKQVFFQKTKIICFDPIHNYTVPLLLTLSRICLPILIKLYPLFACAQCIHNCTSMDQSMLSLETIINVNV